MERFVCTRESLSPHLADSIFVDRGRQFVERLKWNLCVKTNGHEIDEYDDEFSQYLIVHENDRHMGSCRVRPANHPTMITDHFLESFPYAADFLRLQKGRLYELTRFCRAPGISAADSKEVLRHLTLLMDQFRDKNRLTGFIAVVFPHVARFMDLIGMRYLLLSQSALNGQTIYMICITHAVRVSNSTHVDGVLSLNEIPKDPLAA